MYWALLCRTFNGQSNFSLSRAQDVACKTLVRAAVFELNIGQRQASIRSNHVATWG